MSKRYRFQLQRYYDRIRCLKNLSILWEMKLLIVFLNNILGQNYMLKLLNRRFRSMGEMKMGMNLNKQI